MAFIHAEVYCDSLKRTVPINVILPNDQQDGRMDGPFQTIYLLHGLMDNAYGWTTMSRIREWAETIGFAVIMPSADNSFYVDSKIPNNEYGRFVGEELVELTRSMFPLSKRREDTFIGGLSMGGFGALRNGLKYHETFGAIIALSGAIHFFETPVGEQPDNLFHEEVVFGDIEIARNTDKNPRVIVNELAKKRDLGEAVNIPKIFMACGTEDNLITVNRSFRNFLKEKNIEVFYTEAPGVHNWDFWNEYMKKAINWLPLNNHGESNTNG